MSKYPLYEPKDPLLWLCSLHHAAVLPHFSIHLLHRYFSATTKMAFSDSVFMLERRGTRFALRLGKQLLARNLRGWDSCGVGLCVHWRSVTCARRDSVTYVRARATTRHEPGSPPHSTHSSPHGACSPPRSARSPGPRAPSGVRAPPPGASFLLSVRAHQLPAHARQHLARACHLPVRGVPTRAFS